ncbi:uncharacterized protein LOC115364432 [Myripristis murdjan]|uniref:Uncharacterized LOC115364432 n=1 Tax=Myripristis murdjan TaxID=586833 RepID=A0A667WMM2_9TELE|nr:uncharacterized protein LOC115364432 [Myripristis murdjan]
MAVAQQVLERCDPALLELYGDSEQADCVEAARMVPYLMDSRRIHKVLWRQLSVLDSMTAVLAELDSARQLLTKPCPPNPDSAARSRWKALKAESRSGVEQTEALLTALQARMEQINTRRHTLTQLIQQLQKKKEQSEQLEESLQKAHNALRVSKGQLAQLRAESDAVLGRLGNWQLLKDDLQDYVSNVQDASQIKVVSVSQSELCVELRPRPHGNLSSSELQPLKLSISYDHNDRFRLQVNQETSGMLEECVRGRLSELSAALLEVMQRYSSQGDMLAEIQALHSSFAIDWRPAQRQLVYLKSAAVVCFLQVEEGYPGSGRAKLTAVHRDTQPVDTATLQPHQENPSLTDWLVFLCSSPLI